MELLKWVHKKKVDKTVREAKLLPEELKKLKEYVSAYLDSPNIANGQKIVFEAISIRKHLSDVHKLLLKNAWGRSSYSTDEQKEVANIRTALINLEILFKEHRFAPPRETLVERFPQLTRSKLDTGWLEVVMAIIKIISLLAGDGALL